MTAKEVRIEIGADILISMAANEEFPMGNVGRVAKVMQEYFDTEGFVDTLVELGYSWRPSDDYWVRHMKETRDYLRKNKKLFFEFIRDNGVYGSWKFSRKGDFEEVMRKERKNVITRVETFDDRLDDGGNKWKLEIPKLAPLIGETHTA